MNISQIEVDKQYTLSHAYGQKNQTVKVLSKRDRQITVEYISNDASKGLITSMNAIECERYLYPAD